MCPFYVDYLNKQTKSQTEVITQIILVLFCLNLQKFHTIAHIYEYIHACIYPISYIIATATNTFEKQYITIFNRNWVCVDVDPVTDTSYNRNNPTPNLFGYRNVDMSFFCIRVLKRIFLAKKKETTLFVIAPLF